MSTEAVKVDEKKTAPWWAWVITVLMVMMVLRACFGGEDKPAQFGHIDALGMCRMALQAASRDPEKADIPYVENQGRGDEYVYAWGAQTKMARMRNGLGLEVAASASCIVNGKTQRITTLTLNGQTLI